MCCRYFYDQLKVNKVLEDLGILRDAAWLPPGGEINPGSGSLMIRAGRDRPSATGAVWGFPGAKGGLVINARSETAAVRPMFSEALRKRRCLLPAERFFEWDRDKNKVTFSAPDVRVIFLAGLWSVYANVTRFTVLTTAANASMLPVHDRMPLMVGAEDMERWLSDSDFASGYLGAEMPLLRAEREYEQMSLL